MEWPQSFYETKRGQGCEMCAQGRPDETPHGIRFFSGAVADAYLQRADIQLGYTIVIWRGRHVAEPTELSPEEADAYWQELLLVARALETHFKPVKMNYNLLGNSLPHLHTHLIPRYASDPRPGWPFPFPDGDVANRDEAALRSDADALLSLCGG